RVPVPAPGRAGRGCPDPARPRRLRRRRDALRPTPGHAPGGRARADHLRDAAGGSSDPRFGGLPVLTPRELTQRSVTDGAVSRPTPATPGCNLGLPATAIRAVASGRDAPASPLYLT